MRPLTGAAVARWGATPGTVHLVGAGPGDPSLLTLRGAAVLASADVVLHDQLVTPGVLALVREGAEVVGVGRRAGHVVMPHDELVARMVAAARAGGAVVRLKGGDPVVFGRGGEEATACLDAGVPVEFVPGITSAIAGPELAGIPLTRRGVASGFLVVTAHECAGKGASGVDWDLVARFPGTVVVLMGARRWGSLTTELVARGRPATEPAAVIARASTPEQHVVVADLATIADAAAGIGTPAVLVLGEVVSVRERTAGSPTSTASRPVHEGGTGAIRRARDGRDGTRPRPRPDRA